MTMIRVVVCNGCDDRSPERVAVCCVHREGRWLRDFCQRCCAEDVCACPDECDCHEVCA